MRISEFSAVIPEGREHDSGHVEMTHGTVYTIHLTNHDHRRRCDARVEVDGKEVGTFRLERATYPNSRGRIEHPVHDTGRFTFYRSESAEAAAAGEGRVPPSERGLVVVTFLPERLARVPEVPLRAEYGLKEVRESREKEYKRTVKSAEEKTGGTLFRHPPDEGDDIAKGSGPIATHTTHRGQHTNSVPRSRNLSAGVTGLSGSSSQCFQTVAALDTDPLLETTITLRLVCVDPGPRELTSAASPNVTRGNPTPSPVT